MSITQTVFQGADSLVHQADHTAGIGRHGHGLAVDGHGLQIVNLAVELCDHGFFFPDHGYQLGFGHLCDSFAHAFIYLILIRGGLKLVNYKYGCDTPGRLT